MPIAARQSNESILMQATRPPVAPQMVPPRKAAIHGIGRVGHAVKDGRTRLADLYQSDPVRILFPTPPRDDIPTAAQVTTSGGLVGGDLIELSLHAGAGAAIQYHQQAAEKVYRSAGEDSRVRIALECDAGAWMEWLPQETILFDQARLDRHTVARIAPGGRLLAGEITVLGRTAMGEDVRTGLLREHWQVYREDRLAWADQLLLEHDLARVINHPAGLDGARCLAMALYAADDAADRLDLARDLLAAAPDGVRAGATVVGGLLLVRLMGTDSQRVRRAYGHFWAEFRHRVAGLPASLPRLWDI